MDSNQTTTVILLYYGWRHSLGMIVGRQLGNATRRFLIMQPKPLTCWFCKGVVTHKDRSVDHIIPVSVIRQLEIPGLLFDHRNMRPAHTRCNTRRGDKVHDLPESVLAKLRQLGYSF